MYSSARVGGVLPYLSLIPIFSKRLSDRAENFKCAFILSAVMFAAITLSVMLIPAASLITFKLLPFGSLFSESSLLSLCFSLIKTVSSWILSVHYLLFMARCV